ncbi:MAG: RecX family transcriptional regulator [Patescibacteria group bacterium]
MKKSKQAPVKNEEIFEVVYKKALNFLSFKERTLSELDEAIGKYLFRVSIPRNEKENLKKEVLEELGKELIVDDASYVKDYILECVQAGRQVSKNQISQFLYRKGIPREDITEGIEKYYTPEVEEDMILSLCEKKMTSTADRSKMLRYLLSKGFTPSIVYAVVDTKFKRY